MDRDWDNLIILDACRFDYFAEHNTMDGELHRIVSQGSHSREFIEATFSGEAFHDTILVTANPFVEDIDDDVFFRVCYADVLDHWDESLRTVPPSAIVDLTVEMHKQYPDKRIISHFMQPHAPYIGPTGIKLSEQNQFGVFNPNKDELDVPDAGISRAVREGYVDPDELRQAYAENVEIAIEHAEQLVQRLDGRSVITADHGEALGERGVFLKHYGHSPHLYVPELRTVPWFVVPGNERRNVTAGTPASYERLDDQTRSSRLQALGYVQED
ncbi:hypothetical protein [Halapricum hydrolyticum]|uniref:Sulfatase N-terminal domain-containing protein n=1 Tax=Halapricum hydrolyticum TaxID=2979991 RepID=A0AAE3IGB8_9EURY|nr:hypothetical protein [Halapricum hydrolyticum]MCU4719600.1 hypothetical protein [Halapricum hydrolyticum]MCU4728104.1 hypothetical protein [Halapricum hydrolyticum]